MARRTELLILGLLTASGFLFGCRCAATGEKEQNVAETAWTASERDSLEAVYLQKGAAAASATFAALGAELRSAMTEGGVEQAVPYCNLAALPITDSLAEANDCLIRRTALRWRNPANAPDTAEAVQLHHYDSLFASGSAAEAQPELMLSSDRARYYAPIPTVKFCLSCHGAVGTDIAAGDYTLIRGLYPDDRATDFSEGDLRGMWSIEFTLD